MAGLPEADRLYVFTKGGLVWDPASRSAAPRRVGDPASLRAEVKASLWRLNVERIDLYQMHWPAGDGTAVEDYWQAFLDLKREGKVRAIGLSNHDIYQLEAAESIGNVDAIQPPFNLLRRDADDVLLWAHEHETGVIVYSPMASGLLSGRSPSGGRSVWTRVTGGPVTLTSLDRRFRPTSLWRRRCARVAQARCCARFPGP